MGEYSYTLDILAILGICLEILGFMWMLKYHRTAKYEEYIQFYNKLKTKNPEFKEIPDNFTAYHLEIEENGERNIRKLDVPHEFVKFHKLRKSNGIKLVILGLVLQIGQIVGNDLLHIFSVIS